MINNETLTIRELDVDLTGGQFVAGCDGGAWAAMYDPLGETWG